MYNSLESINKFLYEYFGDNLISLVVFGSYSKKPEFNVISDIDYFIILEKMPKVQSAISREIKRLLRPQFPLIAFNIYSKAQYLKIIEKNYWLVLSLSEGNDIFFDKNNFFKNSIDKYREIIESEKVGRLSWYINNYDYPEELLAHYRQVSDDFLESAKAIFKNNQIHIACELLLRSIHAYMIGKLMRRNFYITSGEITQLFFDVFGESEILKYKDTFLRLEQCTGQYYSFGFDKKGIMSFSGRDSKINKRLFTSVLNKFVLIKNAL